MCASHDFHPRNVRNTLFPELTFLLDEIHWIPPLYVGPIHFESVGVSAPLFIVTKRFVQHVYSPNLTSIVMNEYISLCRRYYKFEFIIKKMQSEAIIKKKKKSGIEYLGLSETEGGASVTGWATHQQRDVCCCWRRD